MHFILTSYLFFAKCRNKIVRKQNLINEGDDYLEILKNDFKIMSECLERESIDSIEIFMNQIFEKLSDLIINSKSFNNIEETKEFENKVDEIIIKSINNYQEYKNQYIKENYDLLQKDEDEINYLIVKELIPIESVEYEDMKFFILTKNKLEENDNYFKNYIYKVGFKKCQILYPLLSQYLFGNNDIKKLKYLPQINKFSNYLLHKFSHKISRKEASEKKINDNDLKIDKNLLNEFLKSWNEMNSEKKLSEDSYLINFLIDNKEHIISKVYRDLIKYQNIFLLSIISNNKNSNGILHFYYDSLNKKINIQNSINSHIDISNINIDNISLRNSKRDIFKKGGIINYSNYNSFKYDLAAIEEELGEKILPGKCLFEENELKFITFWGEGNPDILTMFIKKYQKQEKLNLKEEEIIMNYNKRYKNEINVLKEFYESFRILFFYLDENKNKIELNLDKNMNELLQYIPPDLNLSNDFYQFLNEEGKSFKLDKIVGIFLYFEHLYFGLYYYKHENEFGKNMDNIDLELLNELDDDEFKNEFIKALRRYITRYLIGNRNIDNIKNENLIKEFYKSDLWGINYMKQFDEVKNKLDTYLKNINIKIDKAFGLYELFGEKDKETMKSLKDDEITGEDEDNANESEEDNLNE